MAAAQSYRRAHLEAARDREREYRKSDRAKEVRRERYQKKQDTIREQKRASYQRNRDAILEKQRARVKTDEFRAYRREYHAQWRARNPRYAQARNLMKLYGLTLDDWDTLLITQSGRCAICLDPMTDPHVDHDHVTGAVRGLLCSACNRALGIFRDDPIIVQAAAAYLALPHPL